LSRRQRTGRAALCLRPLVDIGDEIHDFIACGIASGDGARLSAALLGKIGIAAVRNPDLRRTQAGRAHPPTIGRHPRSGDTGRFEREGIPSPSRNMLRKSARRVAEKLSVSTTNLAVSRSQPGSTRNPARGKCTTTSPTRSSMRRIAMCCAERERISPPTSTLP